LGISRSGNSARAQGRKGTRAQGRKGARAQGRRGAGAQGRKGARAQGLRGVRREAQGVRREARGQTENSLSRTCSGARTLVFLVVPKALCSGRNTNQGLQPNTALAV